MVKKSKSLICVAVVIIALLLSSVNLFAYVTFHDGFDGICFITCLTTFSSSTKTAIDNSCAAFRPSGAFIYKTSYDHSTTSYPYFNGANEVTKGYRGTNTYLMETHNWIDTQTNKNVEGDVDINASFPWATDGSSNCYDIQNCMTHELGHILGLDNLYGYGDTEKTMYYYAAIGETKKRTLEQDDKDGIYYLYVEQ